MGDHVLERIDFLRGLERTFAVVHSGVEALGPVEQARLWREHLRQSVPEEMFHELYPSEAGL